MNLNRLLTLGALALLAGCATADRVKALEEKVASLEEKIDEVAKSGGKAAPRDEKAEKAAAALYEEIGKAIRGGDTETAKKKLGEMKKKYSSIGFAVDALEAPVPDPYARNLPVDFKS